MNQQKCVICAYENTDKDATQQLETSRPLFDKVKLPLCEEHYEKIVEIINKNK